MSAQHPASSSADLDGIPRSAITPTL
jgi:hypothetical protein